MYKWLLGIVVSAVGFYASVLAIYDDLYKKDRAEEAEQYLHKLNWLSESVDIRCESDLWKVKRKWYEEACELFINKKLAEFDGKENKISREEFLRHLEIMVSDNKFGLVTSPKLIPLKGQKVFHFYAYRKEFDKIYYDVVEKRKGKDKWSEKIERCNELKDARDTMRDKYESSRKKSQKGLNLFNYF